MLELSDIENIENKLNDLDESMKCLFSAIIKIDDESLSWKKFYKRLYASIDEQQSEFKAYIEKHKNTLIA